MATIGFVGLGAMGSRFAHRLLAGNTVCGTNRTPAGSRPAADRTRNDLRLAADAAAGLGIHMATATVASDAVDHGYANRDLAGLCAAMHGRVPATGNPLGSRP